MFEDWKRNRKQYKKQQCNFYKQLKSEKKKLPDELFHQKHEAVFQEIDCLDCANCCKTTSPIFRETDIGRLAKRLKMKASDFKEEYLRLDDESDFVLKGSPCPFLGHDNKCIVYEDRPKACREYPHTDRKRMYQILPLTFKNAEICPAVFRILERIKIQING